IRTICRVNLEGDGFAVLEAKDGAAALDEVRRQRPSLVLLDVMMPGIDGWDVAERVAADPATRDIPVVFLSARTAMEDRLRAPAALYVLAVLVATAVGGRARGLTAAALSLLPFYYFFLVPHHTWAVKPEGAVALGVFLLTAVLGGEVLARQQEAWTRAEEESSSRTSALNTALRLQFVADALVSAKTPQDVLDAVLVEGVRAADARAGL